ncbi:MAG: hypothetical protein IJY09_09480 [Lachnospiraceae bacterium]|nr:hypothetical protein [Lachnospiraceae bacterium]
MDSPKVDPYFACMTTNHRVTLIGPAESEISEPDSCTTAMLDSRRESGIERITGRTSSKTNTRFSLDYLCQESVSNPFSTFYTTADSVESPDLYSKTVVLNYIHNQDGKK